MAKITKRGNAHTDPFAGWYGKCTCGTEFRLLEGDVPHFRGISIKHLEEQLKDELNRGNINPAQFLLVAFFPCPAYFCHLRAVVSPFPFRS